MTTYRPKRGYYHYEKDLCNEYLEEADNTLIKSKIVLVIDQASSYYPFNLLGTLKKYSLEKLHDNVLLIYQKYQQKKKAENLVDFNDLMLSFCEFLDTEKSTEFKNKVKFIFFDEYQDVNPIQHYILSKFKGYSKIMVVGDDAQAIYAFRGSSVDYILNFPNEFKPNKMYLLGIFIFSNGVSSSDISSNTSCFLISFFLIDIAFLTIFCSNAFF
jgi:DNA helicase-2/ATP-dependent DNA helicase PcrA